MYRRDDGKVRVSVAAEGFIYGTVDEAIDSLRKAAEGLEDPQIDYESDGAVTVFVQGWRNPTTEEITQMARDKERSVRSAREQLRRLRVNFPSLFDKQGRPVDPAPDPEEVPF